MNAVPTAKARGFHGWKVLAMCTLCQFVAMGFTIYLIGVFIEPLAAALAATPGQIGSASALFVMSGAIMGPILGYVADKGRTRQIMLLGGTAMALGFVVLSQANSLLFAALACICLLAPGCAMLGAIPTTVMIVQWFQKRRGLAIGIAAAGISSGGFIMPPLAAWLLQHVGWRGSFLLFAGFIAALLLPLIWRWAIEKPAAIGQHVDGADTPPEAPLTATADTMLKTVQIVTRRDFWSICLAVGVLSFFGLLIVTYLAPYARETGMSLQLSAMIVSIYSISGIAGKFTCGWLCDQLPVRWLLPGTLAAAAIGWLPFVWFDGFGAFAITACAVGFAMGALIPVWSTLVAQNFGAMNFGRVRGLMSLLMVVATILPGPLGGYLYDTTGTYATAFAMLWWLFPLGIVIALFAGPPRVGTDSGTTDSGTVYLFSSENK